MAMKWKRLCYIYFFLLCAAPALYLTGVAEWLMSKSIQNFTWPLEVDTDQLIKDYKSNTLSLEPINRKHFKFTVLPREACQNYKLLTVLIKTRVEDLFNRDVLRRSWIQALIRNGHRYAFLVGECSPEDSDCRNALEDESESHHDILQANFVDAYYNNTYKMMMGLKYVTDQCVTNNKTSYLLVIDGDYALNVYNLEAYIRYINKPTGLYCGQTWWKSRPYRIPYHKHYLTISDYPYSAFPPYVTGGAMLLSADVVEKFYITSQYTKYFPFDDVFYGMLAKKLGIVPTDMGDLLPSYHNVPQPTDSKNVMTVGSHRFGDLYDVEHIYLQYGQEQYMGSIDFSAHYNKEINKS